jgi:hypothetical protein
MSATVRRFNWAIRSILVFTACFSALMLAGSARAQCGVNTVAFSNIALVPGNAFQAEYVTTSSIPAAFAGVSRPHSPELVARDAQGRVRIERSAGKFKIDTGSQEGSQEEQHVISICDPVSQTLTHLDTLNKTAQIRHSRTSSPSSSLGAHKPLCSRMLPQGNHSNLQVEDLGHRTIEGLDAQGVRITMKPLNAPADGPPSNQGAQERWCSEELAAMVLQSATNSNSETTSSTALTNLERREPDPALFQIPAGYTVSESVPEPKMKTSAP